MLRKRNLSKELTWKERFIKATVDTRQGNEIKEKEGAEQDLQGPRTHIIVCNYGKAEGRSSDQQTAIDTYLQTVSKAVDFFCKKSR